MAGEDYEPNRVLGISWTPGSREQRDEEPQRVMGFPVARLSGPDGERFRFRSLAHPVQRYRRWQRRRRLGPFAVEDEPPRPH
jgi:hypothetical protein